MNRSSIARLATLMAAVAAALLALASPAWAATITVYEDADELNGDGDCALREAVRAANGNVAVDACAAGDADAVAADRIEVPADTDTDPAPDPYLLSIGGRGRTLPRRAI